MSSTDRLPEKTSAPSLRVEGIHVTYPTVDGELIALRDVTFSVMPGEFVCLVGPSGCGKSTLLRILAGLLQPDAGSVFLDGKPVQAPQRQVGIVFQQANLMPWRTVLGNVLLPLEIARVETNSARQRANSMIELVGLHDFASAYPADLSGGMAQRVAIARALVHRPSLLLLDEPFGSLDALTRERMGQELLRIWHAEPITVLMVTHSVPEAVFLADRVFALSPRPGTIEASLHIGLRRPRELALMGTQAFGELTTQTRAAIRRD